MLPQILRKIKYLAIFLPVLILFAGCHNESSSVKKIGIIIPIEHKALNEIVAGFTESLRSQSPYPVKFKITNAQGDLNLQRALIQQMKNEHYDLVVPIGTATTQMSAALIHQKPIVSLAATFTEQERQGQKPCNIAVVHDEIPPQSLLIFIQKVYPNISHLTLIHSASDKIFPDVAATVAAGRKLGIEIKPIMVPSLNELYSIAHALPQNTQGILILKDNLIASGISTLAVVAAKQHLPLMTSDQGTVEDGAAFALGVHERQIGTAGAKLAASILAGKSACQLPIVDMTQLTVFVNTDSLKKENQSLEAIQSAAKKQNYTVELYGEGHKNG